jgi:hypothetical protein
MRVTARVVPTRSLPPPFLDDAFIDPRDWVYDLPTAYADSLPPLTVTHPCLWRSRPDKGDKFLTEERRVTSRDEYRHLVCYGMLHATINTTLETIMDALRPKTFISQAEADT